MGGKLIGLLFELDALDHNLIPERLFHLVDGSHDLRHGFLTWHFRRCVGVDGVSASLISSMMLGKLLGLIRLLFNHQPHNGAKLF